MTKILSRSLALLFPAVCLTLTAHAASGSWTGALDGDFLNPGNWSGGVVPGLPGLGNTNQDEALFRNGPTTDVTLGADHSLKFLTFDNRVPGMESFTLSGSTFSLGGGVAFIQVTGAWGAGDQTIDNPVQLTRSTGANDAVIVATAGYEGAITLNGAITTGTLGNTTQLSMRSGVGNEIVFNGGINDNGTGKVQVNFAATSTGRATLAGVNAFTGGLVVQGGHLTIADTANAAVLPTANVLTLNNATVEIRGASTGASSETTGTMQMSQMSTNRLVLNPNGGAGVTLEVAALGVSGGTGGASGLLLLELGAGSVFRVASALPVDSTTATVTARNGLVMSAQSPGSVNYRATYLVKDAGGLGFATQNAANELVRYTGATLLSPGVDEGTATSVTTNYLLTQSLTRSAALPFSTLQIDTSGGAVTLDMGANNLNATAGNGRAILVTGTSDTTITGTGSVASTTFIHNHSTGVVTLDQPVASGQALVTAGPGHLIYTKSVPADLYINEGTTRLTFARDYNNSLLRINGGGVLEIGADLNAAATGDFSRTLATAPAAGQMAFFGSGGFSAHTPEGEGTRIVRLNSGGAVQWAANGFVSGEFVLSSDLANATLEFANTIDLNNTSRVFNTRDGSADIDARLAGAITDTGADLSGIYKAGEGTLEITAATSSYDGTTDVAAGRLIITGVLSGTNALISSGDGTIQLGASDVVNNAARVKLEGGTFATGGFSETLGALTMEGTATLDLGAGASIVNFANSSAALWTGGLTIAGWSGLLTGGGTDQVFFGFDDSGLTAAQVDLVQFLDPAGLAPGTYDAEILPTGELVAVPEPASAALLLGGVALLATRRRSRARA